MGAGSEPMVALFAPATTLSVTIETTPVGHEVHVHAAGQGFWVARMLTVFDCIPLLCTPLGGETGTALRALLGQLPDDGFVSSPISNGSYIHDRRDGDRVVVAEVPSGPLDRHTLDDLVSATMGCALRAEVAVICGTNLQGNIDAGIYTRLCADLRAIGVTVVADLSGDELRAALDGGIDVLKVSHEELVADEWAASDDAEAIAAGMEKLHAAGAGAVVVSRAENGAMASIGGELLTVVNPQLTVVDHRGAGDSMTAALAYSTIAGTAPRDTMRIASAAATLNVTRHGLASGQRQAIDELARLIEIT